MNYKSIFSLTLALLVAITWLLFLVPSTAGADGCQIEEKVKPGITHIHRLDNDPDQNIHVLKIDLTDRKVRFRTGLANDTVLSRETISSQVKRYGALAGINADFGNLTENWDFPHGMTVQDGELITSPKYRTGLGITSDNKVYIGKWMSTDPPSWAWHATVTAADGESHPITHWNQAAETGWISVYTHRYTNPPKAPVHRWKDAAEVLVSKQGYILRVAPNAVGMDIPVGGLVLIGRGSSAAWIFKHFRKGEKVSFDLKTIPDWHIYNTIVGGGPRLLKDGEFVDDPMQNFDGVVDTEDFELRLYKKRYYKSRHPRMMLGITEDKKTMIIAVVDGRAVDQGRNGMSIREAADFLKREYNVHDALQFDSGGSACMVINGKVVNHVSDKVERPVTNSLLIYYDE